MKTTISKIAGLCFIATALISCSKSNDKSGSSEKYGRYLNMKIDGAVWTTDHSFELKFVEQGLGVDENADSYPLLLSAIQSGGGEVFQILLYLPLDKIDNPAGSYPIISDATRSETPGTAEMIYTKAASEIIFSSRTDPKGSPDAGVLTITGFTKGDGAFAQRQINWLKGTFSATLKATVKGDKTGEIIKITDGAFEMPNAIHQLGK